MALTPGFILKKLISRLFFPLPLTLLILGLSLWLLLFTRKQKTGKTFVLVAFLLLTITTIEPFATHLIAPVEQGFPAVEQILRKEKINPKQIKWIVVLGGGHTTDPKIPITSQIGDASLYRTTEGMRLARLWPWTKVIFSGGGYSDPKSTAYVGAHVALALGLSPLRIVLEEEALDTAGEARLIQKIVEKEKFVLVTSASHMKRALQLFEAEGMRPIPAATRHLSKDNGRFNFMGLYPAADAAVKSERAVYEYLGLAWNFVKMKFLH